jgi:uncharacterized protein YqjF (DUF2071 family)
VSARIPGSLELDLYDGLAWVSLVAFKGSRMRPSPLPPVPILSDAQQINLRTYVRHGGLPGIWFFSLDATNPVAVWSARLAYRLPCYHARMRVSERSDMVSFKGERTGTRIPASFSAEWRWGVQRSSPQPGTLDSFLPDRYLLYAACGGRLIQARIHHRPWPLRDVALMSLDSTMLEAEELSPSGAPLQLHAQATPFDVEIWPPAAVRNS